MLFDLLLCLAIILDLVAGDPRWFPHPVRLIGFLLVKLESGTRKILPPKAAGLLTVFATISIVSLSVYFSLFAIGIISSVFQAFFAVILIYTFIAIRDLLRHSNEVYKSLITETGIESARRKVGQIVGRETDTLDRQGIVRACIETVAENMVDGITAPLFWAVIFSLASPHNTLHGITAAAIGIAIYKTINTMDSMFGYKNERYLLFGWSAARLDDAVNFLPARISGLIVPASAFLLGFDGANSMRILRRDRLCHTSPNAGHTESAIAGALHITLGGPSSYFGTIVEKPTLGDGTEDIEPALIKKTHSIILLSSVIFLALLLLFRKICIWFF